MLKTELLKYIYANPKKYPGIASLIAECNIVRNAIEKKHIKNIRSCLMRFKYSLKENNSNS